MSDRAQAGEMDDLVYMLSGEDENGDTLVFGSGSLKRAEERHMAMLSGHRAVKANWLDRF